MRQEDQRARETRKRDIEVLVNLLELADQKRADRCQEHEAHRDRERRIRQPEPQLPPQVDADAQVVIEPVEKDAQVARAHPG